MKGQSSAAPGPRYQALIELLRTAETLWNASRVFFTRWDLSPSQFNVLNLLYEQPGGCSQISLSRQLIMHRSNVTGLVDRLESRGLVRREEIPADRRAFNVVLTPAGKKLIRAIQPHYYRAAETVWTGVPVERAKKLVGELQSISASAEKIAEAKRPPNSPTAKSYQGDADASPSPPSEERAGVRGHATKTPTHPND